FATFNDAEQLAIKRVWQRVAEDFAPFDIDVTTERPASFGTRTAHALITRNTDANGAPNPSSTAGGVAYISVFGESGYSKRRPAWIFYNNLGNSDSVIAGAISHEIGHNLGLSHDGATNGTEYYRGHGSGDISWSPIMGSSSSRNVTQWSKGEYYQANNTEDDLAIIAARISYRTDDHGDTAATARPLVISGGTNIVSTTPELDPGNASPANKGILERNTDVDVFSFTTGNGPAKLMVNPWITPTGARGGNLDLLIELRDANGSTVATNNPGDETTAQIQKTLAPGTYYLWIRNSGAGAPLNPVPTGYTAYGSIGQYFISGFIAPSIGWPTLRLTATANNSSWGTVSPTNATYAPGTSVQVIATPANYYRFERWTNSVNGTNNPLTFVLNTNVVLQAVFAAKLTTNHPTPYWWLASYGYLDFENAVNATGANGFPLWQSYLAGLNPNDPNNQLKLSLSEGVSGAPNVLNWNTVTGRVYTLWFSTNLAAGFSRVPAASNLPATTRSFTQTLTPAPRAAFYRIEAIRP
ncbi:MAG TPA: M12 family metallo-peptidase, partial [Verrucomicrobiae bacterium]|nr:M12 family metallo-peptidase [Verrucomicrobiae bacterium]